MISRHDFKGALAALLALSIACGPAHALVNLNDGHDHINVTGRVGWGWDSNVYANRDAESDTTVNTSIVAEYTRRAGWIGVNASAAIDSSRYNVFNSEDFNNPKFNLELTKRTGRTTGSLTLAAARQSRADAAINVRSTSWNYNAGLAYRYRLVGIYTLSGHFGYSFVSYTDDSVFPDLATYTASADIVRVFSNERDVTLGYRYRKGETSIDTTTDDHAVTLGMTGKLIRGINGSLRVGYQARIPHGSIVGGADNSTYHSWTAAGSATYALNKRTNFTGTLSKDFSTTATDTSVDTTTASLSADFAFSSRLTFSASVTAGDSKFLGEAGRVVIAPGTPPVLGPNRHDNYLTAGATISYSLNQHLKAQLGYNWFKNWSTFSYADFVRSTYDLSVTSGW